MDIQGNSGVLFGLERVVTAQAIASVCVDVDVPHLDRPLDYAIGQELADAVVPGVAVKVHLAGRSVTGWVLSVRTEVPEHRLSPIDRVISRLPVLSPSIAKVARKIADRQVATLSQALSLALPQRHVGAEKSFLAQDESQQLEWNVDTDTDGGAWHDNPVGCTLLAHLSHGDPVRSVWTALGPTRDERLVDCIQANAVAHRGAIIVAPTHWQASQLYRLIQTRLGVPAALMTTQTSAEDRYLIHLQAMAGELGIVVGTRSSIWTPLKNLGLIVIWDDSDDRLVEQRAPRADALDIAMARCAEEHCSLLIASFSRSVKAQALVESGWAVSLMEDGPKKRALVPTVRVVDDAYIEREGPSGAMRIPSAALATIRTGLATGPVLVQVAHAGYVPVVSCSQCRSVARCHHCHGPLEKSDQDTISCSWCHRPTSGWQCPTCAGTRLRHARIGSERTGEELARAMPTASVLVSSSSNALTRTISHKPQLVVATPGSEPLAEGGYHAVVILDAQAIAGRPELWAPQEAMRRWFNALALARPEASALICGGITPSMAQALIRYNPVSFAHDLLEDRKANGFLPAKTVIAIDGQRKDSLGVAESSGGELLGEYTYQAVKEGTLPIVRSLVSVERDQLPEVLVKLKKLLQYRSAHKLPTVKITVNPPELF